MAWVSDGAGRNVFALFLALLLLAPVPAAEKDKGRITGTVTSDAKVAVAGATVIAFNLDTGEAREVKSDADGKYELVDLPKGDYELTAVAEGFDIFGSDEIKVSDRKSVRFDIELVALFESDPSVKERP